MTDKQRLLMVQDPLPDSSGRLCLLRLRPGLSLKYEDLSIAKSQKLSMAFETGIRMVFAFQGATHIRIGHQEICFDSNSQFSAALFPVLENSLGYKQFNVERNKKELVIFLTKRWLDNALSSDDLSAINELISENLRPFYFGTTPLIERQLAHICSETFFELKPLQQEYTCLSLIHEVIQLVLPNRSRNSNERLTQIADKIDVILSMDSSHKLSIKQIAHQCHSNATTIQRVFKKRHGITLGNYRRQLQLQRGHSALRAGASVLEAAQIADYTHLQSFSDAFRAEFGCLPSAIKRDCKGTQSTS
ncbi:helix-turn-helix domain-containing protein [Bacterioplanes sanyensis]|uniref:helix-turn-helix domain-containing protein n=1 Tax=Bacterioplanes sanyensis TaxID=1249553 RepID=UPI0012FD3148|nr:helix-turn-helix transcriptional regulator [Bacterioplanes sanyensis]